MWAQGLVMYMLVKNRCGFGNHNLHYGTPQYLFWENEGGILQSMITIDLMMPCLINHIARPCPFINIDLVDPSHFHWFEHECCGSLICILPSLRLQESWWEMTIGLLRWRIHYYCSKHSKLLSMLPLYINLLKCSRFQNGVVNNYGYSLTSS